MSKSSQRRNIGGGVGASKSVGKASSQGGNSFAQSQKSAGQMGTTAKSQTNGVGPNIVIDIESESLTYNQARSIRL